MNKYLRPEARPADWNSLDNVQQDAFGIVAKIISEAIEGLPEKPLESYFESEKLYRLANSERASRNLFISGGRGTGKTTVLVTLIQASLNGEIEGLKIDEINEAVKKMHEHVIWLEPFDMETLPNNSNLLCSILTRIDAAIRTESYTTIGTGIEKENEYGPRNLFEPSTDFHDSMLKLQRLQTDIAIAWDGNIQSREGHLDPDAFALEMMRSEQSRLHINNKFHQVLDLLSYKALPRKGKKGSLFVLPVDDLDLNPSSCLKLLNLLRLISVPRLFTVILGDLDLAGVVLNLKFSSDLAQVAHGAEEIYRGTISRAAANISSNSLRKLIPANQRINLWPMSTWESLKFRPLGSEISERSMYKLLKKLYLQLKKPFFRKHESECVEIEIENLAEFLLFNGIAAFEKSTGLMESGKTKSENKSDEEEISKYNVDQAIYNGIDFLNSTPREIADIWFGLKSILDDKLAQDLDANQLKTEINSLEGLYLLLSTQIKNRLFQEFTYEARESIKQFIRKTPKGEWELGRYPIKLSAETERVFTIQQDLEIIHTAAENGVTHEYEPRINLRLPKGWRFEKEEPIEEIGKYDTAQKQATTYYSAKIPAGISSAIMLFHDLLTLCEGHENFKSTLFVPSEAKLNWATTKWHFNEYITVEFYWPPPPCNSFWEYDVFIQSWKNVIQDITLGSSDPKGSTSYNVETFLFIWLSAGTSIVDRIEPVKASTLYEPEWPDLIERLNNLKINYDSDSERQEILEWLINIAILIMPESGLPGSCGQQLLNSAILKQFWKDHALIIAQKRAQILALFLKAEMKDLVVKLISNTSNLFVNETKPDESLIYRYAGIEYIEEEKEKKRSRDLDEMLKKRFSEQFSSIENFVEKKLKELTVQQEQPSSFEEKKGTEEPELSPTPTPFP